MSAKRRQSVKREGYSNWCPDSEPTFMYMGKVLTGDYDRNCYLEGHYKASSEYTPPEDEVSNVVAELESKLNETIMYGEYFDNGTDFFTFLDENEDLILEYLGGE